MPTPQKATLEQIAKMEYDTADLALTELSQNDFVNYKDFANELHRLNDIFIIKHEILLFIKRNPK